MSFSRRLSRVVPVGITLLMFIFGTQISFAQTTFVWDGGGASTDWDDDENWFGNVAPGTTDYALFNTTSGVNVTVTIPTGTDVTIGKITVDENHTFNLYANLFVGSFIVEDGVTGTLGKNGGYLQVNTLISFGSGSVLAGSDPRVTLHLYGTMEMDDLTSYVGPNVTTLVQNADFVQSDLVFYGLLHLNSNDVALEEHDVYLAPDPDGQLTGYNMDVGKKQNSGSFVTMDLNYAYEPTNNPSGPDIGKLYKGFSSYASGASGYFTYPLSVAMKTHPSVTLVRLGIIQSCAQPASPPWLTTTIPFPAIGARVVYNPGGASGGHPGALPSAPTVLFHWPIYGHGVMDSVGLAGYVAFHNEYRNNGVNLFSAIYKDHLDKQDSTSADPLFAGEWDVRASQLTPTTGGDYRWVPFGPYDGLNYLLTTYATSYSGACMKGYGDIGVGTSSSGEIPVELTTFSAHYKEGSVRLNWQTATEINNNGFYIERSVDEILWDEIDFVQGAGNSSVPIDYQYDDVMSAKLQQLPRIAYRLRQEDRDGTIDYSGIVYAFTGLTPDRVELYEAYPNPFNPSTVLSYYLEEDSEVNLRVYNMLGREVATLIDDRCDAGFHSVEFNGDGLPSGMYMAVLSAGGAVEQKKLVLNK